MCSLNNIFWIVFAIAGIISVVMALTDMFFLGIVLALMIILSGIAKLEQDAHKSDFIKSMNNVERDVRSLKENVEKGHYFASTINEKTEKRLQRLDAKRVDADRKAEKRFRDLVRKIIEIENTLNKMKKDIGGK